MLVIHHLAVSQSERVIWLCEELGVPYELVRYERGAMGAAPPEFKSIHPAGTAPTIVDGDVVLAESAAVMEYIIEQYSDGRLARHKGDADFADYLFWFHYANGSLAPSTLVALVLGAQGAASNGMAAAVIARVDSAYAMIEKRLGEKQYFAGDEFSAADIFMVFALTTLRAFLPRDISGNPNLTAYLQRVTSRPAYQRAMKKADPHFPRKI
jgi:glutathione S-transferase